MVLQCPRYPELDRITDWREAQEFYIPELEMTWGQTCSAMKKSWKAYTWARKTGDAGLMEAYAILISQIREGLGYDTMQFNDLDLDYVQYKEDNPEPIIRPNYIEEHSEILKYRRLSPRDMLQYDDNLWEDADTDYFREGDMYYQEAP